MKIGSYKVMFNQNIWSLTSISISGKDTFQIRKHILAYHNMESENISWQKTILNSWHINTISNITKNTIKYILHLWVSSDMKIPILKYTIQKMTCTEVLILKQDFIYKQKVTHMTHVHGSKNKSMIEFSLLEMGAW